MPEDPTVICVWPGGAPAVGDTASMERAVTSRDIFSTRSISSSVRVAWRVASFSLLI